MVAVVAGGGTPRLDAQCLIPVPAAAAAGEAEADDVRLVVVRVDAAVEALRAISRGVSTSVATSNSVGSRERRRTLQESIVKNKKREQSSNPSYR